VGLALKQGKKSLAHDGRVGVVRLLEQHVAAHGRVAFAGQQAIHQQHLAEGGSRLGQGQRGVESEQAVVGGQHGMYGVAQLVGQGGYVAWAALVVGQHPRGQAGEG